MCHGVPSPEVWVKYLNELRGEEEIKYVNFRHKENKMQQEKYDYS